MQATLRETANRDCRMAYTNNKCCEENEKNVDVWNEKQNLLPFMDFLQLIKSFKNRKEERKQEA